MLEKNSKGMPTVTVVVGLVSTLLIGSAILGSLQAIKTTSLDPNVDQAQNQLNQVGDKTITISASDRDIAKKQMQGAIVWNMLAASDCRILTTFNSISQAKQGQDLEDDIDFDPDEMPAEPVEDRIFKTSPEEFLDNLAGNQGNGYAGNFGDFMPLVNSGFDFPCVGTQSTIKQVEDAASEAGSEAVGGLFSIATKSVGAGLVIAGAGACVLTAGGACVAVAAGAGLYMSSGVAGDLAGEVIVPGAQGDIGAEPGFDMEGVFSRMEFNTETTFLMGTEDPREPFLGLALKFEEPDNTPGFWRGKRFSYLLPAGLSPNSFEKIDHRILSAGQGTGQEVDGVLCLGDESSCPPLTESGGMGGEPGGLYVLNMIYEHRAYTLSDPEALEVASDRIEWILDNKDLLDDRPNRGLQQKLEGVETKSEFISEVYADRGGVGSGIPLSALLARLLSDASIEPFLKDGETLPNDFPDKDVSGKYSLVRRSSGGDVADLVREDFEDAAPGTQQERKKMMFYSFRPRMENVPIIAAETITEGDLTEGCSDCTDMERLKNFIRHTSYLFCAGASGQIQSNAGHIFSSDEATSQESAVEDQVYPKVEITNNATGCIPTMTLSVPDNVNLDCDPEAFVNRDSVEVFSRLTTERGLHTVDVVCGTDGTDQAADLGGYGNVNYYVTEETISQKGCFADWYDITTDAYIGGDTLHAGNYPITLAKDENTVWSHDYNTYYGDRDGENEIGGSGENNRITYNRLSVEYNASTVENLTYRVSMQGISSGRVTRGMLTAENINRTIIVEERPESSETIVREIAENTGAHVTNMRQVAVTGENFSGDVRELVIDRTSSGGISINGVELAEFEGFPDQIAITGLEISPVRNAKGLNQRYDWSSESGEEVSDLNATQTDLELRSVQSYSEPRVCKGQRGIWESRGKEVIEG